MKSLELSLNHHKHYLNCPDLKSDLEAIRQSGASDEFEFIDLMEMR